MSLELTDHGYDKAHEIVDGLRAAARDMAGMVPNHIWGRVHTLATKLEELLYDEVVVDTSDDGDGVDASKEEEKQQEMRDMLREEGRAHFNLDADPPKTMRARFHPADVELFYECNHREEEK